MISTLRHRASSALSAVGLTAALVAVGPAPGTASDQPRNERTFIFDYRGALAEIPEGAHKVAVWLPLPRSDENQDVKILVFSNINDLTDK